MAEACSSMGSSEEELAYKLGVDDPDPFAIGSERFEYECFTVEQANAFLNECAETVSKALQITPSLAKLILHSYRWNTQDAISKSPSDPTMKLYFMVKRNEPAQHPEYPYKVDLEVCNVCLNSKTPDQFRSLACEHVFCKDCWVTHLECQISEGNATDIKCMACEIKAPEDFVLAHLYPHIAEKYQRFLFRDFVASHPQLKNCQGIDCTRVFMAKIPAAKQVTCRACKAKFCFNCGNEYHEPMDCESMKKWLLKTAADAPTAEYIMKYVKCCPRCRVCMVMDGGCNHVNCFNCKHHFCWLCMENWEDHSSETTICDRYFRARSYIDSVVRRKAEFAVQKYMLYFTRWKDYADRLQFVSELLEYLKGQTRQKVAERASTLNNWIVVLDAYILLFKCRHILKYGYVYAYYMEQGPRKKNFEYQHFQIEIQADDLTDKIKEADLKNTDSLVRQFGVLDSIRISFLKEFFEV